MSFRVLVSSPVPAVAKSLVKSLGHDGFKVVLMDASRSVMDCVLDAHPDILILDIDRAQDAPEQTIHALRKVRPHLRIIALGAASPIEHADVLDEVFSYLTRPVGRELAEVVEAAGRALERRKLEEGSLT